MPNYEYRCTECENQFELWQEVGAEAPPCPECQAEVKKVFHPIRTIYKGSGFYITDTRTEKSGSGSSAGSSTTEKTEPTAVPAAAESSSGTAAAATPPVPPKAA